MEEPLQGLYLLVGADSPMLAFKMATEMRGLCGTAGRGRRPHRPDTDTNGIALPSYMEVAALDFPDCFEYIIHKPVAWKTLITVRHLLALSSQVMAAPMTIRFC